MGVTIWYNSTRDIIDEETLIKACKRDTTLSTAVMWAFRALPPAYGYLGMYRLDKRHSGLSSAVIWLAITIFCYYGYLSFGVFIEYKCSYVGELIIWSYGIYYFCEEMVYIVWILWDKFSIMKIAMCSLKLNIWRNKFKKTR